MVVGDQHLHAQTLRRRHTLHAGDAVVNGDEHISARIFYALGNGRCQAVAIDHPVGHDVADLLGAQHAQAPKTHSASSGAVAIVVGHDAQF